MSRSDLKLTLLLAALAGCGRAQHVAPAPMLTVITYNIHAGKDAQGRPNLDSVAALVKREGADIVLLQEVDRGTRRSGNVDQPAVLSRLTGYHAVFGKSLDYDGGDYGIAVLSRWPVVRDSTVALPVVPPQERAGGSHEPRSALLVVVQSPAGPLAVIDTHLDPSGDDHYRRQEVRTLLDLATQVRAGDSLPLIVGGDLNSTPESATQAAVRAGALRDAWAECGNGQSLTYPADVPRKRIDYLYLTPRLACRSARVIESQASDHRPVIAELTLAARH